MSSLFFAPGAIEHYIKPRNASSFAYLGTAVTAPEIEIRPAYLNVINDIGGRTLPMQKVGDREQHVVTTTLNRFDIAVYQAITCLGGGSGPAIGGNDNTNQGTLVIDNLDFEFIFIYAAVAANRGAFSGYPLGRRYYSSLVIGARESTVGTRVEEITLVIECNEVFTPATRVFDLYSESDTELTVPSPS